MDDPAFADTALTPDDPGDPALDETALEPGPDVAKTALEPGPDVDVTALEPGPPSVSPSAATTPGPAPGRRVGPFEVVRELARGGMGVVYVARHPGLERELALKVLLAGEDAGTHELARFAIEARAAARLRHPNIVGVHDVGEVDGRPYIAMDLIPGESLKRRLAAGPLAPRDAATIAARLARAVAYAHQHGVLHRDLKPANVLMQGELEPVLTDFGLAKVAGQELTASGQLLGTPAYMPPEQADGNGNKVDGRADVYSLGATLYEMLVGRAPFVGASALKIIADVLAKEPARPRAARPELTADLETVVLTCLEKDPARRYATADALADDLERFLRDEPVRARPAGALERAWRWGRRNPAPATAWALTVVVAIVASFAAVLASREASLLQQARDAEAATEREARARAEAQARADEEAKKTAAAQARRDEEARAREEAQALAAEEARSRGVEEARAEHELGGRHAAAHRWRDAALAFARACADESADQAPVRRGLLLDAISRLPPLSLVPRDGRASSTTDALAWSPAGDLLAIAHSEALRAWDPLNRREVWAAPGRFHVERLAFAPVGARLLVEGGRRLTLRDGRTGAVLAEREAPWDRVYALRWSPDGERIAVGVSRAVEVLDGRTLASIATVTEHADGFNRDLPSLTWTRDGASLAFVQHPSSIKVWRPDATTSWAHQAARDGHAGVQGKVCAASADGAYVAMGCADGSVHLWKTADGSCFAVTRERDLAGAKEVVWVEFAPGAFGEFERLASFDDSKGPGAIRLWELRPRYAQRERLHLVRGLEQVAEQLIGPPTWSPDGARLACADRSGGVHVWETRTGALETLLQGQSGHEGLGQRPLLAWSPDGARLAAGGREYGLVHVWTLDAPSPARRLRGGVERVKEVTWTADGQHLWSSATDYATRLWDSSTGAPLGVVRGVHPHGEVAVSPDGARAVALSSYGALRLLDGRTCAEVAALGEAGSVRNVAWSSDGARVAALSGAYSPWRARVWDRDGRVVATLATKLDTDRGVLTWRPGAHEVAITFGGRGVLLWTPGEPERVIAAPQPNMIDAFLPRWSPDGSRLAGVSIHGRGGALWAADGAHLADLDAYMEELAWSPDGARLATTSGDGGKGVNVWDGRSGARLWTVASSGRSKTSNLAWSADGAFLAGASVDGGWIRDGAAGGEPLLDWTERSPWPWLAWSPTTEEPLLAAAVGDQVDHVLVLDPRAGRAVVRFRAHESQMLGVAWRPTGDVLATAGDDAVIGLWDLRFARSSSEDLVRWLEEHRPVR